MCSPVAHYVRPFPLYSLLRAFPLIPVDPVASRCFALLALAVSLWVSEAMPYYATALLICPLVVFFDVMKNETVEGDDVGGGWGSGSVMSKEDAAQAVYQVVSIFQDLCNKWSIPTIFYLMNT